MFYRNELHLHTKLSDDISVIGVSEIFESAEKSGIKSIAFTNLNNVQDFSQIMRCHKKYKGIKPIYGAEVQYRKNVESPIYNLTLLAKNQAGIKELYRVISSMEQVSGVKLIDLQTLKENRENLFVGSCGPKGELFHSLLMNDAAESQTFYDYFEIFPSNSILEREVNKKIFSLGEELDVPVVAVGNCHYISKEDKICCDVIKTALEQDADEADEYYLRTTEEMLNEFMYLDENGAKRVVLENPQILSDLTENVEPLKTGEYYPIFKNSQADLESLCYTRADEIYGSPLPQMVQERLHLELEFLKDERFATQYLLAKKIVDFAVANGQKTMARGSVGSVFVAFLLGISEANPLPPHYRCPDCNYFESSNLAADGFDLPQKACPTCGKKLKGDGHNIPYEIFMGINGDKTPDIDLGMPGDFISQAQNFAKGVFGADKVAQAGTIQTLTEFAAKGYIAEYETISGIELTDSEKENILKKITGIKRAAGVHPGGLMIIPDNMDFEDFTPLNKEWTPRFATHFDFHSIYNTLLKQDILGYTALDLLLELEKQTGESIDNIDFNDPKIYELLQSGETDGTQEFENKFTVNLLQTLSPQSFNDLVKISCFAHGTNVWKDNAEHLIADGVCTLPDAVASQDDIMTYLTEQGMDKATAYAIMDATRKGLWTSSRLSDENKKYYKDKMREVGVPNWYIDSLAKIRYVFPKAHSISYVMNAVRLAWFKVYYPEQFNVAVNKIFDRLK